MRSANSARALPAVGVWNEMQNIIVPMLQQVLLKQKTPQQAGNEMAAQINPLLK
jgi:ABC-type glycerol-3-phosphate transport system substrate-binding protein